MGLTGAGERLAAQERVAPGSNGKPVWRIGSFAHGNRLAGPQESAALRPDGVAPQAVLRRLVRGWRGREGSGTVHSREVPSPGPLVARGVESPPRPPGSDSPRESGSGYPEERRVTKEILPPKPVILRFGKQS